MKKFILILFPLLFSAQTHRFIFEFKFKSDSLSKEFRTENMVLDINPDEFKFYPYAYAENDSLGKVRNYKNIMWDDQLPALKRNKNSYTNTSYILLNDFFSFQTEDKISWNLSNETKKSAQYTLQKATTNFGGRKWTAWFSKEVNLSEGPYKFRGLPGLIFEIQDDQQNFIFSLVKSQKFKNTYDTSEFLESFGGKKPIPINEKILLKKRMELFNDPLRDFKEDFKKSNGAGKFSVLGIEVKSIEQFKELTERFQEMMRKENNPIEIDKAVKYPTKKR
ncbi:MAG TPA: GLPGLI family protein [Kaistella sp.]|nr:GLPGLI family protein [Kaistella sp.]HPZ24903.1 GLPGLI family protein [Kaistella sp.]HQD45498.1 GLPGLI family protein [Kaistella sp.]